MEIAHWCGGFCNCIPYLSLLYPFIEVRMLAGPCPMSSPPLPKATRNPDAETWHGEIWIRAAVQAMSQERQANFHSNRSRNFKFGSDCTGGDAAFTAADVWGKYLQCVQINVFCSESPNVAGPWVYTLLNHMPLHFFWDVLMRGHSGFDVISGRLAEVPGDIDFYSAGTMCTDYSSLNTLAGKTRLGLTQTFSQQLASVSSCFCLPSGHHLVNILEQKLVPGISPPPPQRWLRNGPCSAKSHFCVILGRHCCVNQKPKWLHFLNVFVVKAIVMFSCGWRRVQATSNHSTIPQRNSFTPTSP